jgi:hypothetical protein
VQRAAFLAGNCGGGTQQGCDSGQYMRNQQELPYLFLQGIVSFNQTLSSVLKRWATSCIGEALAAAQACCESSIAISYLISTQTDHLQCLRRINDCARQVFCTHLHCPAQHLVQEGLY